jgi:hypothetical protein
LNETFLRRLLHRRRTPGRANAELNKPIVGGFAQRAADFGS